MGDRGLGWLWHMVPEFQFRFTFRNLVHILGIGGSALYVVLRVNAMR